MYLSIEQIGRSLKRIQDIHPFFGVSFLAFKRARIPIGTTTFVNFSAAAEDILERHYRPTKRFAGYYQPLKTGNKKGRWVSQRYGSTSLQRITKDTFSDALIHPAGTSDWGWQDGYLAALERRVRKRLIPTFHLAVWLYRDTKLPDNISPTSLAAFFFRQFFVSDEEQSKLFDSNVPTLTHPWTRPEPAAESDLLALIGFPPGYVPEEGVTLKQLELRETGPANLFNYQPSERLNIITGDNGLGKTFILDCVWWALTGRWADTPILPRPEAIDARLSYQLALGAHALPVTHCRFMRQSLSWDKPPDKTFVPGVVIYSRFDGSFVVLDPARIMPDAPESAKPVPLLFHRAHLWNGLQEERPQGKIRKLCNGLLEDWVLWQRGGTQYERKLNALRSSLRILSPATDDQLILGEPIRLPGDTREIPTLAMDYGQVPVIHSSAGVQRVITLAYILVWTWFEHVLNSSSLAQPPQKRLVLLIDEVEAHLHPRWQRVLVPGIMEVVNELWGDVSAQIHVGTHSPLVLASAETIFDASTDDLHHLKLDNKQVVLSELPFMKRGTVDAWLMSDAFGLGLARSVRGEAAINEAKQLLLAPNVEPSEVRRVHEMLADVLAEDDRFWPRWRYFAVQHGVDE